MPNVSTIQLNEEVINQLKKVKEYPRQTYNELLFKMTKIFIELKKRDQYDKFLHEIQKLKMKELWNNKEDEAWENVWIWRSY